MHQHRNNEFCKNLKTFLHPLLQCQTNRWNKTRLFFLRSVYSIREKVNFLMQWHSRLILIVEPHILFWPLRHYSKRFRAQWGKVFTPGTDSSTRLLKINEKARNNVWLLRIYLLSKISNETGLLAWGSMRRVKGKFFKSEIKVLKIVLNFRKQQVLINFLCKTYLIICPTTQTSLVRCIINFPASKI